MSKLLKSLLKATPVILGASLLVDHSSIAMAQTLPTRASTTEQSNNDTLDLIRNYQNPKGVNDFNQNDPMSQVTNVSELRDVAPTEWAYEALRSLVERYGCIVGYPDRTYRGDRALSRWEFAAGLNACMNTMERLIQENVAVLKDDIEKLKRLAKEFEAELAALGARVDNLEARVSFLEDHQFSTTTKLEGQVVFGIAGVATGQGADGEDIDKVPVFGYRMRLELNTSFTGEDLLFTRLSTGNFPDFSGEGTNTIFEGNLGFSEPSDNELSVSVMHYTFPVTDSTQIYVAATGGAADDFTPTINFLDGDGAEGAISLFGTRNPIYYTPADAGAAIIQQFGENFELTAGYLASPANDPSEGSGLFNGPYSIISQLTYKPSENFNIGLTYAHNYNQSDTGTGTQLANFRFFTDEVLDIGEVPTVSNSYALAFSWKVSDNFVLGGWGTYTNTITLSTLGGQIDRGTQDIWTWAVTLAFPDLFKEGNVAGIIVGMEPWVSSSSIDISGRSNVDEDTSLHIEGFFQYKLTDNISITPGVVWITSPNGSNENNDLVIGTIRTTFSF